MTADMETYYSSNPDSETMPRDTSGDFLYIAEENPVVTRFGNTTGLRTLYDNGDIAVHKRQIHFADGVRVDIAYSELSKKQPRGLEGMASYESTAWLTQPEGIYTNRLVHLGRLGLTGTVVGSPKNLFHFSSVSENARNQLEVMRWMAHNQGRDPHHMISLGMSEGDMIGNAVADIAEQYDVTVVHEDGQAGAFPNGLDVQTILTTCNKAPGEMLFIADILRLPLYKLLYFSQTIDMSPTAFYTHLQTLPGLVDGTTGKHYRHRPKSVFGHKTLSWSDPVAQAEQQAILNRPFLNESMHIHKGTGHISDCSVAAPSGTALDGRLKTVTEIMIDTPNIRSLGVAALHNEMHRQAVERNPVFRKKPTIA